MIALTRLAARAIALAVMLAVAVVTLPSATAAVVSCCCGDHDAHEDCGCVDCPAGHADGDRGDATPSMKRCGSRAAEVTLASSSLHPPPVTPTVQVVATPAPARVPAALTDRAAEPPPSPPPRR